MASIGERLIGRKNNFDLIRFFAAFMVIVSHSYALSLGSGETEPLYRWTQGEMTSGRLAVLVFFVISGFLITMSYDRRPDPLTYIRARVLRIFPGLMLALAVTALLFGAIVTSVPLVNYFTSSGTYKYLLNIVLKPISNALPGVFESNTYGQSVNGSLWTLQFEFAFYLAVLAFGMARVLNKRMVTLAFIVSFVFHVIQLPGIVSLGLELFGCFSAGMLAYLLRDKIPISGSIAIGSLVVLWLAGINGMLTMAFPVFGTYVLLYLAFAGNGMASGFAKYGDFSYGIYIYGFPVQQIVTHFNGGSMQPTVNVAISFPIVLFFSAISWHLVEKRALQYKARPRRGELPTKLAQAGR